MRKEGRGRREVIESVSEKYKTGKGFVIRCSPLTVEPRRCKLVGEEGRELGGYRDGRRRQTGLQGMERGL